MCLRKWLVNWLLKKILMRLQHSNQQMLASIVQITTIKTTMRIWDKVCYQIAFQQILTIWLGSNYLNPNLFFKHAISNKTPNKNPILSNKCSMEWVKDCYQTQIILVLTQQTTLQRRMLCKRELKIVNSKKRFVSWKMCYKICLH